MGARVPRLVHTFRSRYEHLVQFFVWTTPQVLAFDLS